LTERAHHEHTPIFQRIKDYLLAEIADGRWKEGDMIASEQALLTRRQGAGTLVAQSKYQATLLEMRNIADEIGARGQRHQFTGSVA
jgi:GntR family histidine utilization transcriptional repressor